MSETLLISDDKIFYTLEGEGEYVGRPSVFLRLACCNLTCSAWASKDSPSGCDSYVSWSVKNKMTFEELFNILEEEQYINHLERGAIFKISGGEPLLQQRALLQFIKQFCLRYKLIPRIDFETNATIKPDNEWLDLGATFTTSPKLSTNGDSESKTYKPEVLKWHAAQDSGFKFVITRSEDIEEIWRKYVEPFGINLNRIWFMPRCGSRDEHTEACMAVAEYAKAMHVNFSPRLHLVIWNKALKV